MGERVCERAQAALSLDLDGETTSDEALLETHVPTCADCRQFEAGARALRQQLRYEPVTRPLDLAPSVVEALRTEPAPNSAARSRPTVSSGRVAAVAAAFVVGALVGALLVSDNGTSPGPVAAADIAERVAEEQHHLRGLTATFSLVEHGWHRDVPERQWDGELSWSAPEALHLTLTDRTSYPSSEWVRDDVSLVVDEDVRWTSGPRDCPAESQPTCTPAQPRTELTTGREPFDDGAPVPLDLVLPVRSFANAAQPTSLGERTIAGRRAIGVSTTAAQVQPVLDGLRPAGNLREVHPADTVDLWLDAETMVPLGLEVVAGDGTGRTTWAANRGYDDRPGDTILSFTTRSVSYGPTEATATSLPDPSTTRSSAFVDGPVDEALLGASVPAGFEQHRTGRTIAGGSEVEVASWTDGRAWIKIRSTADWRGDRLFGDIGPVVRTVDLDRGGTAYVNDRGDRVALHGADRDVVISGSVDDGVLVDIAASLGLEGLTVPPGWDEAATADLPRAAGALANLLLPVALDGFEPPSLRVDGATVTARFAGPGSRSFTMVETAGERLAPPLDLSVIGVEVRGTDGRWSDLRGELEWVEGGVVVSLRSASLALDELLAVAAEMRRP